MKENLHPIDKLFKTSLDGHQEEPPPESWENINSRLGKEKVTLIGKRYNELKKIAVAAFLLGFIFSVYALYSKNYPNSPIALHEQKVNQNKAGRTNKVTGNIENKGGDKELPKAEITIIPKLPPNLPTLSESQKQADNHSLTQSPLSIPLQNNLNPAIYNNKQTNKPRFSNTNKNAATQKFASLQKNSNSDKAKLLLNEMNNKEKTIASREHSFLSNQVIEYPPLDLLLTNKLINAEITKKINIVNTAINPSLALSKLKQPRFSLTGFYSKNTVNNHLKENDPTPGRRDKDDFKNSEHNTSSFSTGLILGYSLNKTFSLETGILYSTSTTSIFPKTIYAHPDNNGNIKYQLNCSAGYSYIQTKSGINPSSGDSTKALTSTSRLQYIGLPLNLKYHISAGRLSFNPVIGLNFNYLLSGNVGTTITNGVYKESLANNSISGLKSGYLNGSLSFEAAYNLTRQLSIVLAPTEQMAITSINNNTPVKTYPSVFGISAGLHVNF